MVSYYATSKLKAITTILAQGNPYSFIIVLHNITLYFFDKPHV
ncbi:hypothetical protein EUBDOL_00144 [Amedibacillus dolichus DSM 3991]|uniref:Uncharacterized protein n=1 Tax=Amedibacillus dolichus DSM 3991 TaxID=428127 RepID=A8R811_9FIRM|nr:hypothetical protein EUBDOL_00144 [Amedibacillus dolichus DSM 3991]